MAQVSLKAIISGFLIFGFAGIGPGTALGAPVPFSAIADDLQGMSEVAEARFSSTKQNEFANLVAWSAPTAVDPSHPCQYASERASTRAMVRAAQLSSNAEQAVKLWKQAGVAIAAAKREVQELRSRSEAKHDLGHTLTLGVKADQIWEKHQADAGEDGDLAEIIAWRSRPYLCDIQQDNSSALKRIMFRDGWPAPPKYTKEESESAWLALQHDDNDLGFQEEGLRTIEPLVKKGEFSPELYAYLYDRIALAKGRPQKYGTQFESGDHNCLHLKKSENLDMVAKSRGAVKLPLLSEAALNLSQKYHLPLCKYWSSDQ